MKKFDGILICTDLDGTLYKNDKTISKENMQAIEHFKEEGGKFTFITGRMPYFSKDVYEAVNPNCPFGCINGGGIYDHIKEEYVWVEEMSDAVYDLVEFIDKNVPEAGIQIDCLEKIYFSKNTESTEIFRQITGVENLVRPYREITEPVGKVVFSDTKEENLQKIKELLNSHPMAEQFAFVRSERILYEILPKGVNKGTVLPKIAEITGTQMRKTIALGDYYNDIEMLKAAGVGIAVKNACQDAKDAADIVTVSNEESAIAAIVNDIEKGIIKL